MARPHTCPVCQGRGTVPQGFYNHGDMLTSSLTPEQCRTCLGTGIVWDYTVIDSPSWGYIPPITCKQDINKKVYMPDGGFTTMGDKECNTQSRP